MEEAIVFSVVVEIPGSSQYNDSRPHETIVLGTVRQPQRHMVYGDIDLEHVLPEHVITPQQSHINVWLCRREFKDADNCSFEDIKLLNIYQPLHGCCGAKGTWFYSNVKIDYTVAVAHVIEEPARKKFKIRLSTVMMHDHGVGQALKYVRKQKKRVRESIESMENYYREVLGYEDSVMKKKRKRSEKREKCKRNEKREKRETYKKCDVCASPISGNESKPWCK